MRVYVAAKWEERSRVRHLYSLLRAAGHEVTHDWTQGVKGDDPEEAVRDLEGVCSAEVLVVIPHERGRGLFVELGAALALGRRVVSVGVHLLSCLFLHHPLVMTVALLGDVPAALGVLERS